MIQCSLMGNMIHPRSMKGAYLSMKRIVCIVLAMMLLLFFYNPWIAMGTGETPEIWEEYLVLAMGACTAEYEKQHK